MVSSPITAARQPPELSSLADPDLVARARTGDETAVRVLVQRYNRRLFRSARAVVRNDAEAEDVVQAAYVQAFTHLDMFRGEARLSTWLTRIALNEALGRVRRRRTVVGLEEIELTEGTRHGEILQFPNSLTVADPEAEFARGEVRRLLESAVDGLPDDFRLIFVLRDIEGLTTREAASHLGINTATAKTRLHRARGLMRLAIEKQLAGSFASVFPFDGERCAGMADRVACEIRRLRILSGEQQQRY
jgi:RNA polymerase sigma-70 factor, ECF subfamily